MARNRAFEHPKTTAEHNANKVFRPIPSGMDAYSLDQKQFHSNRERLKAERLAREAALSLFVGGQFASIN